MLNNCPELPISSADASNNVVARFVINGVNVNDVLSWYQTHGFTMVADSSQTNGYGPDGVSFIIYGTNQTLNLMILQWKDF